jgi:hypothetical protein
MNKVNKIKKNYNGWKPSKIEYFRDVGINKYSFIINDDDLSTRENLWYFSNEFEEIIKNYKILNNIKNIQDREIESLFIKYKNELKDLESMIDGYY